VDVNRRSLLLDDFSETHGLSAREHEVLKFGAEGHTAKEISSKLGCTVNTVDEYWSRIFRKVGLRSRVELLAHLLRLATDDTFGP